MSKNFKRSQGDWGKKGSKDEPKVLLSFEKVDIVQGQSLKQWNSEGDLLLKLLEMNAELNKSTYFQAITKKLIVEYDINDKSKFGQNNMPKDSKWTYPKHLNKKDVKWCKIRLGSTRRVIGYMEDHVFKVIFLDKDHQFYPTDPHDT
jgi:hypothetical protein